MFPRFSVNCPLDSLHIFLFCSSLATKVGSSLCCHCSDIIQCVPCVGFLFHGAQHLVCGPFLFESPWVLENLLNFLSSVFSGLTYQNTAIIIGQGLAELFCKGSDSK